MRSLRLPVLGISLVLVSVAIAAPTKKTPPAVGDVNQKNVQSSDAPRSAPTKNTQPQTHVAPTAADLGRIDSDFNALPIMIEPTVSPTAASSAAGDPINMDWYSINNGGAIEVAAGNIKMGLSIGQNAVGEVQSGNIKMGLGFWYGASAPCPCQCHADPVCDSVTDIFDVIQVVNVAFRGASPITDPNPGCGFETTNVNCDEVTDIFDVILTVNVAFRGGDPAVQFCNPCSPSPALSAATPIPPPQDELDENAVAR